MYQIMVKDTYDESYMEGVNDGNEFLTSINWIFSTIVGFEGTWNKDSQFEMLDIDTMQLNIEEASENYTPIDETI